MVASSYQDTGSSNAFNILLSSSTEKFGFDNVWELWELSLSQNFVVAPPQYVSDEGCSRIVLGRIHPCLVADQRPQLIQFDSLAETRVSLQVVMPHPNFPKVTWVIFVEVDPEVMHASSISPTSRVLPVLADVAIAFAHVFMQFPSLPQSGWHASCQVERGHY